MKKKWGGGGIGGGRRKGESGTRKGGGRGGGRGEEHKCVLLRSFETVIMLGRQKTVGSFTGGGGHLTWDLPGGGE